MATKTGAGGQPQEYDKSTGRYGYDSRKDETAKRVVEKAGLNTAPEKAYGFANKERKNTKDHKAHAKEMGFKNQDEYEQAAILFWEKGEGIIYQGKRRNDFAKYNKRTKQYIVVSTDGYIKTFYLMAVKKFKSKEKQEVYEKWTK